MSSNSARSWRCYALAAVVALGLSVAWCLAVVLVIGIVQSASGGRATVEQLFVGLDGEPYILRSVVTGLSAASRQVVTLSGEPAQVDAVSQLHLGYRSPRPGDSGQGVVPSAWQSRLAAVNDGGVPLKYWYLVHDGRPGGRAYGVGYDAVSKRIAGYFARDGFSDRMPPPSAWFEVWGNSRLSGATPMVAQREPFWDEDHALYFLAEGTLWAADVQQRQLHALADVPAVATVTWTWDLASRPLEPPRAPYSAAGWAPPRKLLVRSHESCTLVDPGTGEQLVYPLPAELRQSSFASFHLADGNLLLISWDHGFDRPAWHAAWLDPQGSIARQQEVRLAQVDGMGPTAVGWTVAGAAPLPLGQLPAILVVSLALVDGGQAASFPAAVRQAVGWTWHALLVVVAMGAAAAVAAYRRQQRFGLPGAVGWAAFAFLFGAPGWIAYRWHGTWPVLEDCPHCGQLAPHDRDQCIECGVLFPPPELKGIEVFA